jgi:non-specific serine/threonine protein kinase
MARDNHLTARELRTRRRALGLTQAQLAEALGVAANTVARWERADTPVGNPELVHLALERLEAASPAGSVARRRGEPPSVIDRPPPDIRADPQGFPSHLTSFVGRVREVAEVIRLLRSARLVTLTGAGGVGKTRLAVRAAEEVTTQFLDGGLFVPLAPITEPLLVTSAIAQLLEVRDIGDRPLLDRVNDVLRHRQLLLVLDNFEQVLDAAPIVSALLVNCPQLKVLVTSRAVLHISGEHTYAVLPLAVPARDPPPTLDRLTQYEAVRLFLERAQASKPQFAISNETAPSVAEICARLDGLPLAIELAAAQVRVLTPQTILARLSRRLDLLVGGARDEPERHQTLRAAIAWSYDLLTPSQQVVFRRLGVFVGGCELGVAESVLSMSDEDTAPNHAGTDILHILIALVEQGLVQASEQADGETRFTMLETIREYALERLRATGDEATMRRLHRDWCLGLAERAEPELWGPHHLTWADRLDNELDNIWAALEWSKQEPGEAETGLRLASALWRFWDVRGHLTDGRAQIEALIRLVPRGQPALSRGLYAAGYLAFRKGDISLADHLSEQALQLARELGDEWVVRWILMGLGSTSLFRRDLGQARALLQESLELARSVTDDILVAAVFFWLAELSRMEGDYTEAATIAAEYVAISNALGSPWMRAFALSSLGDTARLQGEHQRATRLQREALTMSLELRDLSAASDIVDALGIIAVAQKDLLRACRLFGSAEAVRSRTGASAWVRPTYLEYHDRAVADVRQGLDERTFARTWREGQALSFDQAVGYAMSDGEHVPAVAVGERTRGPAHPLTAREQEVAVLIARGLTNRQIGERLVISERTAERHVENILDKLGLASRTQIGVWITERDGAGIATP